MKIIYIDENTDFDALFGRSTEQTEQTEPTEAKDSSTEPTEPTEPTAPTEPTEATNDGASVYHFLYALFGE